MIQITQPMIKDLLVIVGLLLMLTGCLTTVVVTQDMQGYECTRVEGESKLFKVGVDDL